MYFRGWRTNLRLIAGVGSALAVVGTFAAAHTDYLPATRGYAQEIAKTETGSALSVATARIGNLQMTLDASRLQINDVRRAALRADEFTRQQQLAVTNDPVTRELLTKRLRDIADELSEVDAERTRLRLP